MADFNQDLLVQSKLADYQQHNIKVVDEWHDRSDAPSQGGVNNAIIELENGSRIKIVYMYEDHLWMPV